FEQDFAVGQHWGPWTAGLGGYVYQQISDDVGPGLADGNRSRARALGPALSRFQPGSALPLVSMHLYRQHLGRGRTERHPHQIGLARGAGLGQRHLELVAGGAQGDAATRGMPLDRVALGQRGHQPCLGLGQAQQLGPDRRRHIDQVLGAGDGQHQRRRA
ncbi:hypothetical protein KXX11_003990, partial [Aspergillus fumigatus]